ncbi:MAG: cohesin domain-containing protein [Patescibacteria group bacterium]|nr:cohesin domain-containing protein [Patescibacteria group bacterium]
MFFIKKFVLIFILVFLLSSGFIFYQPKQAEAAGATLFISPASGTYTVNRSFTIKVMVNSGGGAGINAAESNISYDPEYITVSKLSDAGTIFKLWTADPTYSNSDGRISFGGGAPGAYTGTAGTIFSITFRAKKIGTTEVNFSNGIVLAADGKGTNVFSGYGNGRFTIAEAEEREEPEEKEKKEPVKGMLPPLPEISSQTHSDEEVWYADNEPEFTWKLLADLTGVSYLIDEEPDTNPGNVSDGIIESERFSDISDGIKYFHIKYQNKVGWGQTAHRKFMVDVTPPEDFALSLDNGGDATNPSPKLVFSAEDEASGIEYYNYISGPDTKKVMPEEVASGYYRMQPSAPGEYNITLAAVDKAGNAASSSIRFIIESLKAPIITSIPKLIDKREELIIQGKSFYPQVTVEIYLGQNGKDPIISQTSTDDEGNWSYFYKGSLEKGNYEVWAKIIDERGAQSLDSARHLLTVISPSIIDEFGWLIILILIIIIIGLIIYIFYQRKEFKEEKNRIKTETDEVKEKLRKIFAALREELDELIELADKKPGLSDAERRVKEKLQESLDISEEFITKEIEDVEKEIKLKKNLDNIK